MIVVDYIEGLQIPGIFARRKYEENLLARLKSVKVNRVYYRPLGIKKFWRLSFYLFSLDQILIYPLWISLRSKGKIKHLLSQESGYLLNFFNWKKNIVTVYDLIAFQKPWLDNFLYRRYLRFFEKGLKKAHLIVTISEYSKAEISRYLNFPAEKIEVVYPAIDRSYFKPAINQQETKRKLASKFDIKEPYILYVGSEQKRKNLPRLAEVFAKLKKEWPSLKLVKVGNPQEMGARNRLLCLINDLGVNLDVLFFDQVSEEDLVLFYQGAESFVFLSGYEGFGMPVLEAMACGCPVVCSNSTSLPEVAAGAAFLVDPQDKTQIASAVHKILADGGLRERLIEKGLRRASDFSWEKSAAKLEKLYLDLNNQNSNER